MYHIEQLRSKEIADLQSIAQELEIKGYKSLDRDSLIYRILDGQAMQNSKAGAPAVVKEENRMNRREHRRNRIHSDAPSKVYTATGDKAVKLDKSDVKRAQQKSEKEAVEEKNIIAAEKVQEPVREVVEAKVAEVNELIASFHLNMPVAGKTGTTDDQFDIWFCGFTPSSAATTITTISVSIAPCWRIAAKASCPGVSKKVIFRPSCSS